MKDNDTFGFVAQELLKSANCPIEINNIFELAQEMVLAHAGLVLTSEPAAFEDGWQVGMYHLLEFENDEPSFLFVLRNKSKGICTIEQSTSKYCPEFLKQLANSLYNARMHSLH